MKTKSLRRCNAVRWALLLCALTGGLASALPEAPSVQQDDFERSVDSVVRHKNFYKKGRFEVTGIAGIMPYDSVVNHYMVGGRFTWHLADHWGWEVIDAQLMFPSVTSFTTNLVSGKGISNLQTNQLRFVVASNLLISPIYGKIRWLGTQVLHFDTYLVVGIGLANNDSLKVSATGTNAPAVQTVLRTGFDPMFDFGLGFKIFLNNAMGLVVDLRDYVVLAQAYGKSQLKSNFSVYLGLTFFLPTFG